MPLTDDFCRPSSLGIDYNPSRFYHFYCKITMHGPLQLFFHAWVYVVNCLFLLFIAYIKRAQLLYYKEIIWISLSGLAYFGAGFFYIPACEFRYAYWTVLSSFLALVLLISSVLVPKKNM